MSKHFTITSTTYDVQVTYFDRNKCEAVSVSITSDSKAERKIKNAIAKEMNVKPRDIIINRVTPMIQKQVWRVDASTEEIITACMAMGITCIIESNA